MTERIEGYKDLARLLASLGVPSSRWSITRWVKRERDPFPLRRASRGGIRVRHFVYARRSEVLAWVERNFDPLDRCV